MTATRLELSTQVKGTLPGANCPTLDVIPTPVANLALGTYRITGLGNPVNAQDAATKAYVDAAAAGLSVKPSCTCATTGALPTNTYANGTAGSGATLTATTNGVLTIDGHAVALNDRVLVKSESTAANNGIYYCSTAGAAGAAYVLTRVPEMSTSTESIATGGEPAAMSSYIGAFSFVEQGTANAGTGWFCTTVSAVTVGTTSITWTQFSAGVAYTAGNGISITTGVVAAVAATNSGIQVTSGGIGILLNGSTLTLGSTGLSITAGGVGVTQLAAQATGTGLKGGNGSNLAIQESNRETPSGTINGSNTAFTLAQSTIVSGTEMLFKNGLLLAAGGADYTISGTSITMTTAPIAGDVLLATYYY